jgi:L-threonylcarbamoyladenylate synthase
MKTVLTNDPDVAASFVKKSKVVAFPTETVYGLGANIFDDSAIKKIYKLKGRPSDNPLIVHVASKKQINLLASAVPEVAKKLIKKYFPGPLTLILKKNEFISDIVTSGLDTIAIRFPTLAITKKFIKSCQVPIAAPSANLSGSPSPTKVTHVLDDFKGKVNCILLGKDSRYGIESTVIDCTVYPPVVLRPGVISLEELKSIDANIILSKKTTKAKSPGTKYKHYSPKAKVILINWNNKFVSKIKNDSAYIGLTKCNKNLFRKIKLCSTIENYAKNLFTFFRECDKDGIKNVYAENISEKGIGLAIMNRLKKASL